MAKKKDEEKSSASSTATGIKAALDSPLLQKFMAAKKGAVETELAKTATQPGQRIPTGIFELDYGLAGGVPIGQATEFFGPESSGKTTIMLRTIASAQLMCRHCYLTRVEHRDTCKGYEAMRAGWIDVERSFDPTWAARLGVDTDELALFKVASGEDAVDALSAMILTTEFDIIGFDSIAFAVPTKTAQTEATALNPGGHARLMSNLVAKTVSASTDCELSTGRRPTLLFSNQIRFKIGVMFGNPETVTGGEALKFLMVTRIRVSPGKTERDASTELPILQEFRYKVVKNKASVPKMEGEYSQVLTAMEHRPQGSVTNETAVMAHAERIGLMVKAGGGWECLGEKFASRAMVEQRLLTDGEFFTKLSKLTMEVLLKALA